MFDSQLATVVSWFDTWNETGQAVALIKMVTRVSPIQARFIAIALDHTLNKFSELALQEQAANNPGFVGSLLLERKEVAMAQLLLHLPLLRPDNYEAKQRYLTLLPSVISHSIQTYSNVEEARQLLAYILIHPALKDAKGQFEPWRKALGELIIMNGNTNQACQASAASVSAGINVPGGSITAISDEGAFQQKTRRSNSLTPPFGITPPNEATSQDDMVQEKARRFSLSSDREVQNAGPPLSPQSSQASSGSGSEVHLEDLKPNDNPGMRDLHCWLKSLRLHKYAIHLSTLTYDQMMSLNEDTFDQIIAAKVTQGARRKMLLSITKLRERYSILCKLEQDVINNGNLLIATEELKTILESPMRASPDEEKETVDDIPFHFTKVLGKVCTQLIVNGLRDDDSIYRFKNLLDVTLSHEAFVNHHRRIASWKVQIERLIESRFSTPNMFLHPTRPVRSPPSWGGLPIRYQPPSTAPTHCSPSIPSHYPAHAQRNSLPVVSGLESNAMMFLAKRPSLQDRTLLELKAADAHSGIQRTQSAPPNPAVSNTASGVTSSQPGVTSSPVSEPEINTRLETLCRQMTEKALSGGAEL
ncbi:protein Smaug homolog 1 [Nilaparvata lugens]|uniref:protein Smaug homolog 1 n=1 Tax=Nilaparvata lugens TaxID=108931 RepID=UPI00193C972D|nr:protein Smaug homolog 1 [Nilaparvata lugens]